MSTTVGSGEGLLRGGGGLSHSSSSSMGSSLILACATGVLVEEDGEG